MMLKRQYFRKRPPGTYLSFEQKKSKAINTRVLGRIRSLLIPLGLPSKPPRS